MPNVFIHFIQLESPQTWVPQDWTHLCIVTVRCSLSQCEKNDKCVIQISFRKSSFRCQNNMFSFFEAQINNLLHFNHFDFRNSPPVPGTSSFHTSWAMRTGHCELRTRPVVLCGSTEGAIHSYLVRLSSVLVTFNMFDWFDRISVCDSPLIDGRSVDHGVCLTGYRRRQRNMNMHVLVLSTIKRQICWILTFWWLSQSKYVETSNLNGIAMQLLALIILFFDDSGTSWTGTLII